MWNGGILYNVVSDPGDFDGDGDIDFGDFVILADCLGGPDETTPPSGCHVNADLDADGDVDMADSAWLQQLATGTR
jgi:hypothetical protein